MPGSSGCVGYRLSGARRYPTDRPYDSEEALLLRPSETVRSLSLFARFTGSPGPSADRSYASLWDADPRYAAAAFSISARISW